MSTYTADHEVTEDSTLDALAAELAAMQVIAKTLSAIRERDTRCRVLAWANERFTAAPAMEPLPVHPAGWKPATDDPTLEVDSLYEFFEPARSAADSLAAAAAFAEPYPAPAPEMHEPPASGQLRPLAMLLRGLARGVRLLAGEWQTA
jgi:hypothetical protein